MGKIDELREYMAKAHYYAITAPSVENSLNWIKANDAYCEAVDEEKGLTMYLTGYTIPEATHVHKGNGKKYQLLNGPWTFRWEPEWDRPAVLYRSLMDPDVLIGRYKDIFENRFFPLEGEK